MEQTYNYSVGVVKLETMALSISLWMYQTVSAESTIWIIPFSKPSIAQSRPITTWRISNMYPQNLFDSDSDIELVYTYYEYVQPTETTYYINIIPG
jgi:hypothetical protein